MNWQFTWGNSPLGCEAPVPNTRTCTFIINQESTACILVNSYIGARSAILLGGIVNLFSHEKKYCITCTIHHIFQKTTLNLSSLWFANSCFKMKWMLRLEYCQFIHCIIVHLLHKCHITTANHIFHLYQHETNVQVHTREYIKRPEIKEIIYICWTTALQHSKSVLENQVQQSITRFFKIEPSKLKLKSNITKKICKVNSQQAQLSSTIMELPRERHNWTIFYPNRKRSIYWKSTIHI